METMNAGQNVKERSRRVSTSTAKINFISDLPKYSTGRSEGNLGVRTSDSIKSDIRYLKL